MLSHTAAFPTSKNNQKSIALSRITVSSMHHRRPLSICMIKLLQVIMSSHAFTLLLLASKDRIVSNYHRCQILGIRH